MTSVFNNGSGYDIGEYGDEGILSKRSSSQVKNVSLHHSPQNKPKAAASAILKLESGDTINFIASHLDHLREGKDRLKQARAINRFFIKDEYPKILAGDLNDVLGGEPIRILESKWGSSYDKEEFQST